MLEICENKIVHFLGEPGAMYYGCLVCGHEISIDDVSTPYTETLVIEHYKKTKENKA